MDLCIFFSVQCTKQTGIQYSTASDLHIPKIPCNSRLVLPIKLNSYSDSRNVSWHGQLNQLLQINRTKIVLVFGVGRIRLAWYEIDRIINIPHPPRLSQELKRRIRKTLHHIHLHCHPKFPLVPHQNRTSKKGWYPDLLHVVLLHIPDCPIHDASVSSWVVASDDTFDLSMAGLVVLAIPTCRKVEGQNGLWDTDRNTEGGIR
jgi:hypothetical protein